MPAGDVSGCQSCRGQCCRMYTVPLTGHDAFVIASELRLSLEQFAHLLPEPEPTATGVRLGARRASGVALVAARDRRARAAPLRLPRHARRRLRTLRHPSAAPVRLPHLSRALPPRQRRDPRRRAVPARRLEHQRPRPSRVAADDAAPGARVDRVRLRRLALERGGRASRSSRPPTSPGCSTSTRGWRRCEPQLAPGVFDDTVRRWLDVSGDSPVPAFMARVEAAVGSG